MQYPKKMIASLYDLAGWLQGILARLCHVMARKRSFQHRVGGSIGIDDIAEEIRRIHSDYGVHVSITLDVISPISNGRTLRVSCRRRGTNDLLGLAYFGNGVRGGAQSFEGASYVALLNAREALFGDLLDVDDPQS